MVTVLYVSLLTASNWKYDPSLDRETSWMSNYIKCSVRTAGRWLFSASGGQRDIPDVTFEGLVVEDLDVEVLAGTPFMEANDVVLRPAKREVLLGNGSTYTYGSQAPSSPPTTVRRAFVLRAPTPLKTVWPGEFLEVQLPDDAP